MTRYFLIAFSLILANSTNAETMGADWWKNCPGPACPARESGDLYGYGNANKAKEANVREDHEKPDKDGSYEKPIKKYEKGEHKQDVDR